MIYFGEQNPAHRLFTSGLNWRVIIFRLPLNFSDMQQLEALSHMTAFGSRNMPQPCLWWSELESKALKVLNFVKKPDSAWKDTQADKDEILKPTQISHKFEKGNKVLPYGIQAAIWSASSN